MGVQVPSAAPGGKRGRVSVTVEQKPCPFYFFPGRLMEAASVFFETGKPGKRTSWIKTKCSCARGTGDEIQSAKKKALVKAPAFFI
ncbi:MAG: hypothetical protein K6T80_02395 [Firmicutes bacterium]|nr:hypothetical protein [Bacillota bacterium]